MRNIGRLSNVVKMRDDIKILEIIHDFSSKRSPFYRILECESYRSHSVDITRSILFRIR